MTDTPTNSDDIIDSRDIIARIEDLESLVEAATADDDDLAELAILKELAAEGESYAPDWSYGETLVRDSYFKTYAQELADDIGAINSEATWPNDCIDWDRAARELRQDYTAIDFAGVTYWTR